VKPVTLFAYLISFLTRPGATVLDPFTGSGTTICAAAATGREGIGIELDEHYCEIAAARIRHAQPTQLALGAE
jgi:site-specific DNA-methyltransferase (adenine-specific)